MMETKAFTLISWGVFAWILIASTSTHAALFQPDSATASSEFSSAYDIGNAIDGSGLPTDFSATDAHADYAIHNHWTTHANQVPNNASASFFFDQHQKGQTR